MGHLSEIADVAVHDAVDLFEAQIELLVLGLLDPDHETAMAQITGARLRAGSLARVGMIRHAAIDDHCSHSGGCKLYGGGQ
jgi:hypothetical protein